jgi:hypothetical protein
MGITLPGKHSMSIELISLNLLLLQMETSPFQYKITLALSEPSTTTLREQLIR